MISEFNPRRNRVIGDRRQLLVAERAEKQKELFAKISVGPAGRAQPSGQGGGRLCVLLARCVTSLGQILCCG